MKRNTIKWRIFKYNLLTIILLIALTTVVFNVMIRLYMERDIYGQLNKIASRAEQTALQKGPEYFPKEKRDGIPPLPLGPPPDPKFFVPLDKPFTTTPSGTAIGLTDTPDIYHFYFMLDRSLREPLSMLNAYYVLLDNSKNRISPEPEDLVDNNSQLMQTFLAEIKNSKTPDKEISMNFRMGNTDYIALIKPVSHKNSFGLGWIIVYASLQKMNQLQWGIGGILLGILAVSALITGFVASFASKTISAPFSSLNQHIGAIADRNFGAKIHIPVDDELQDFVHNINRMSEKLESYDLAQKTFLQNASHEFRTPLMSIRSYAEGITYDVVPSKEAAAIIVEETQRMTRLVEDILYLSRLEAIEENYDTAPHPLHDLLSSTVDRVGGIALSKGITIETQMPEQAVLLMADEEKLTRAITNILSNCIRYARNTVTLKAGIHGSSAIIIISDDGPGIAEEDMPYIFDRFYKGNKGLSGLGLAISRNVIEKHGGSLDAENTENGARFIITVPISM